MRKEREKKRKESEEKNLFIQINRQTGGQTDSQIDRHIDRHKSFIDMRYNTEQYIKSNSIESDRIE